MKSKSRQILDKTIPTVLKILKEAGGELRGREVINRIRKSIDFNEYEMHRFEKTGYIRWESVLHFHTVGLIKTGLLRKNKGLWILTPEGEAAISLNPDDLHAFIKKTYKEWQESQHNEEDADEVQDDENIVIDKDQAQKSLLNQYEDDANEGIRDFIIAKNPYEFQDLVGALLDGMGYHISDIAQRGPDGGIDIIAYTDPLGTKQPRIIVQVKHRPESSVSSDEVQKLSGTLKRNSDVGIFVTSGQFSKPATKEARNSREHIELIDFDRFISLWTEYYHELTDIQKNMLPLHPIYFLGSNE